MINLHVTTNSLVVVINDTTYVIPCTDSRYDGILGVLSKGLNEVLIKDIVDFTEGEKDSRIEVIPEKDSILIDNVEMPEGLKKQFLDLKRRHRPRSYLTQFWDNLQKNPNKNSINMLYSFLNHNGHPIMASGKFIAYKAVRLDLKDHHTQTNVHKVGKVISMGRDGVDDDPAQTCSSGLHVAAWDYLSSFHAGDSRIFEVLVDPKDVVAVPNDYNGTKMRVSRYKVYREVKNPRKEADRTSKAKAIKLFI